MGFLREQAENVAEKLGVSLVDRERLDHLQESDHFLQTFREELTDVAWTALNLVNGRPHEMRPEQRERLAKRSRIALQQDPLAGAEAALLANFAFGRGVAKPEAADKKVQEIIDEAWDDPINQEKLTGFEAQRHRSNELITQANLFPTAHVAKGRVRLSFLDPELVKDIVCDEEDDERPLYYATMKRTAKWDFVEDQLKPAELDSEQVLGKQKVHYYPHWRNVEDAEQSGELGDQKPPDDKLEDGLVYHVRINRIGRSQWGTPPWARSLRFFSAMNSLTEAHVAMAQAASSIIAKQSMTGGPDAIRRRAASMLSQSGELGAARFGEQLRQVDQDLDRPAALGGRGGTAPVPPIGPAAFHAENQASKLEAVNLSSGAGQAAQTAEIVRAPIAAAAQFGQHYLGDASNANLATATTLELPAMMNVQAWQETHEQMHRWFIDLVIQEAVRAGRLGGDGADLDADTTVKNGTVPLKLSELCLREQAERLDMEARTSKDLSYTFEMPYPGRRNLPDVQAVVLDVLQAFDPNGINIAMRRAMLLFLAKHGMQLDNPTGWVDEVLPENIVNKDESIFTPKGYEEEQKKLAAEQAALAQQQGGGAGGTGDDAGGGGGAMSGNNGARSGVPPVGDPTLAHDTMSELMAEASADVKAAFTRDVLEPLGMLPKNGG